MDLTFHPVVYHGNPRYMLWSYKGIHIHLYEALTVQSHTNGQYVLFF